MDNKETITNTKTENTVVTTTEKKPIEVKHVIFLLFAEFLGYESPLISWCEKICNGEYPPKFVTNILGVEARMVLKEMQKEYTLVEIREWYDKFYPLVLEEYDLKLLERELSDLPF